MRLLAKANEDGRILCRLINEGENIMNNTKRLAVTAVLLAVAMAAQFFKNLNVYITGPVVNLCIILAVMTVGLLWGVLLSVLTPVTAFMIAPSPVMMAVPGIIPLIMAGNILLAVFTDRLVKPSVKNDPLVNIRSVSGAVITSLIKGCFMGLTISLWLLPTFIPEASPLRGKMGVFQMTFSLTQFITAVIGFVYFFIIWMPLKKSFSDM